jgi:predicted transglutaminase-like protease
MKKLFTLVLLLLIIVSSCNQDQDLSPSNNLDLEIGILNDFAKQNISLTTYNLGKNVFVDEKKVKLDKKNLAKDVLSNLNGKFFSVDQKTISEIASSFKVA